MCLSTRGLQTCTVKTSNSSHYYLYIKITGHSMNNFTHVKCKNNFNTTQIATDHQSIQQTMHGFGRGGGGVGVQGYGLALGLGYVNGLMCVSLVQAGPVLVAHGPHHAPHLLSGAEINAGHSSVPPVGDMLPPLAELQHVVLREGSAHGGHHK